MFDWSQLAVKALQAMLMFLDYYIRSLPRAPDAPASLPHNSLVERAMTLKNEIRALEDDTERVAMQNGTEATQPAPPAKPGP